MKKIVETALNSAPPGETHRSTRTLAGLLGFSQMTVHRIWKARRLQPHRRQSFELRHDSKFQEKRADLVGLYLNPPEKAIVLSVDEKPQGQALERKQTTLSVAPRFPEGRSHQYKRNGTIDVFAALENLTGEVVAEFHHGHRHQEFLSFLRTLDRQAAPEFDVHVISDNLSAHSAPEVERWVRSHPRFHLHFTRTHSSWLKAVEGWFSMLTTKRLKRGSFASVPELTRTIREYVATHSAVSMAFTWTKDADEILCKIANIPHLAATAHESTLVRRNRRVPELCVLVRYGGEVANLVDLALRLGTDPHALFRERREGVPFPEPGGTKSRREERFLDGYVNACETLSIDQGRVRREFSIPFVAAIGGALLDFALVSEGSPELSA